jgi:hypothetical protein
MAITPTHSLLAALSSLGTDGARPRSGPDGVRPAAPMPPAAAIPTAATQAAAPDPARPLPRGSLINIVV